MQPRPPKPVLLFRSVLFWLVFAGSTILYAPLTLLTFPFSFETRYRFVSFWTRFNLWWLERTCKLGFSVEGKENLPGGNAIAMVKHQSAWETLGLQVILPPQVWIIKQELLRVPFFGWGLAMLQPIALDRNAGRRALEQLVQQGGDRLRQGRWVVVFPEGTRVAPGAKGQYHPGGALLAARTGFPVVPIAHNAGRYWRRRGFIKYPGTIRVVIGPAVETRGRKAREILRDVESSIESMMDTIDDR